MNVTITLSKENETYISKRSEEIQESIKDMIYNMIEDARRVEFRKANPTPEYSELDRTAVEVSIS